MHLANTQQNQRWRHITIALAGVFQMSALVDRLATTGYLPKEEFHTAVTSLLEQNPKSVEATYGGIENLALGFEVLVHVLTELKKESTQNKVRYVLGIFYLQKKLRQHKAMLSVIGSRLQTAKQQAEHFEPTHDNVIANLADLYTDTISRFRFRIHVRGDPTYLQQQRVANQVRTLLFSGIRSATLWQQLGGKRWHILVSRNILLDNAKQLLAEARRIQQ